MNNPYESARSTVDKLSAEVYPTFCELDDAPRFAGMSSVFLGKILIEMMTIRLMMEETRAAVREEHKDIREALDRLGGPKT